MFNGQQRRERNNFDLQSYGEVVNSVHDEMVPSLILEFRTRPGAEQVSDLRASHWKSMSRTKTAHQPKTCGPVGKENLEGNLVQLELCNMPYVLYLSIFVVVSSTHTLFIVFCVLFPVI